MYQYDVIYNLFRQYKPDIKKSSVEVYARSILKMKQLNKFDLLDEDDILNYFDSDEAREKFTLSYIKNNLVSLNLFNQIQNKSFKKIKSRMVEMMYAKTDDNSKSRRDLENWITKTELIEIYNRKLHELRKKNITKRGITSINDKTNRLLQEILIASFYILIPPRRNIYATLILITNKTYNNLTEDQIKNNNYFVYVNRSKKFMSLGNWKNSNKSGTQIIKFENNKKLNQIINLFYKFNKNRINGHMLKNSRGGDMTTNLITKILNNFFAESGKKISSTIIRKIYISENPVAKELNKVMKKADIIAQKMGHTSSTSQKYYYKK